MLKNSVTKTIGNTPLLRMTRLKKSLGLKSDIFAKLEFLNPAGSIKGPWLPKKSSLRQYGREK